MLLAARAPRFFYFSYRYGSNDEPSRFCRRNTAQKIFSIVLCILYSRRILFSSKRNLVKRILRHAVYTLIKDAAREQKIIQNYAG